MKKEFIKETIKKLERGFEKFYGRKGFNKRKSIKKHAIFINSISVNQPFEFNL